MIVFFLYNRILKPESTTIYRTLARTYDHIHEGGDRCFQRGISSTINNLSARLCFCYKKILKIYQNCRDQPDHEMDDYQSVSQTACLTVWTAHFLESVF